jgi:3-hydroxymyristoyl/3-hydroxydecanoyl-(acyl carrier protein) dehydratase
MIVDESHPSLPGHFPGAPVVPGVVLLSQVLAELREQSPELVVTGIRKLKFLRMLLPGQYFTVEFEAPQAARLRFKCWLASESLTSEPLAEGHLALASAPVHTAEPALAGAALP